ncbi:hypothetical protein TWF106_005809 [Orbilia oligospora]|uniref:Uncharacterized protein n=1 Tax=Orbilia oligospora TaxID=2813651 RepID=A0A6G1M3P0_ORBOL|nr:hypothetical protein TWF788_009840 [Orbilia oligospora]KAF3197220.1 hypothetical protein TWF679_003465 [Orbilia oligospora]KAF3202184.1 hypothetical protein TWF191_003147 [Orbilia oligospora]KAF3222031.1 hypothetical protein TWF106_005809 [Orbilia oligospora]KAF3244027.1 hypothetical protein TWF192_007832 [Orbilia oligospora]
MVAPVYQFTKKRPDEWTFKDMSACGRFFERSVKSDTDLTHILRSVQLDSHAFNRSTKRSKGLLEAGLYIKESMLEDNLKLLAYSDPRVRPLYDDFRADSGCGS